MFVFVGVLGAAGSVPGLAESSRIESSALLNSESSCGCGRAAASCVVVEGADPEGESEGVADPEVGGEGADPSELPRRQERSGEGECERERDGERVEGGGERLEKRTELSDAERVAASDANCCP